MNRPVTYIPAACFLLVLAVQVQAKNSYLFFAPKIIRPGLPYTIQGELLDDLERPVVITADVSGPDGIADSNTQTINEKRNVKFDLLMPTSLKASKKYKLTIKGTRGLTFTKSQNLQIEEKSTSVFIQTDKSVYKPGQTVRFRVFSVTPDLKVVFDKLKVETYDPKGNKIKQWDVSNFELTKKGGVYVQHQIMSEFAELGTWTIKAKLLSYGTEFEEKTFKVEKYVLPKFETKLDLPTYGKTTDSDFHGKVTAKYTFGKSVKGDVRLVIKPKVERFKWDNALQKRVSTSKSVERMFPINGKASFTIAMSKLKEIEPYLHGKSLVFEASVVESLTKSVQKDDQEVPFYNKATKLEIPEFLPKTFKPGMTYNAVVKVAQQDGTHPDVKNGRLKVTITEYRMSKPTFVHKPTLDMRRRPWWFRPPQPREVSKKLSPSYHSIPFDGVVQFPVEVNKKLTKINIRAEYDGVSISKTLKKRHSPSNTYIQLTLSSASTSVKAGETISLNIKSTVGPGNVNYQIYSKGALIGYGDISMPGKQKKWSLLMTSAMAPRARIVVFYVKTSGEVIADALALNVEGVFKNKVSVSFNSSEAKPANKIRLDVTADPGSVVNILAVDKSVLLMGAENDISKSQVLQELHMYDNKPSKTPRRPVCGWFCWRMPMPSRGEDVKDVIEDAGMVVLTDALIYNHIEPRFKRKRGELSWSRFSRRRRIRKGRPIMFASARRSIKPMSRPRPKIKSVQHKDLAPVQRKRKLFPETWLWTNAEIQANGKASIEETVPDTMTTWIATAFAISPNSGLGVSVDPAQLKVVLPFFISVSLPYSVIRGEKVIIQANIHNYSPDAIFTRVKLLQSNDFDNIIITNAQQTKTHKDVTRTLTIGSNDIAAVYFPIELNKLGMIDIDIKAQTISMSDGVTKKLLVEAEGTPKEYNIPHVLNLKERGTLVKTAKVEFPSKIVSGSGRAELSVIGDLMGPSINGLDKLIKMPYGCGEQNMLKFAPNIFILKYLEATQNLDDTILQKAKDFMEKGYQRELTYAHTDGSFSAFGKSDSSGSTWLTAFVVKSFVQAKPYIFVDDKVVNKAIDWMMKHQNADGTFNEPGRVIHKAMQGGSTSGKVSLTSYVLIALLEARAIEGVASKIDKSRKKAQAYLEGEIDKLNDVYDLAIVAYSLELCNSAKAAAVWTKLDAKSKKGAGTKYWEKKIKKTKNVKPWEKRNGVAINIELTAYALLALAKKKDNVNGVAVLKWLTEQRNPDGGFSSTQDTVVALQGLAEMASLVYSRVKDMTISVVGKGFSETFTINNLNALVLQTRVLPNDVGKLKMTAKGQGLALVQVGVSYNVDKDDQKKSFLLTVKTYDESLNKYRVEACARWTGKDKSSMAVIEIGTPSGFYPEMDSIISESKLKRKESEDRKLVLYFDEIGKKDTCVSVTMRRMDLIAGVQLVPVRVYDYYEPSDQVTEFYLPDSLKNAKEICKICDGSECDFCKP